MANNISMDIERARRSQAPSPEPSLADRTASASREALAGLSYSMCFTKVDSANRNLKNSRLKRPNYPV
ncbi:uncharacterized protein N7443_001803 [Penicillium atrosanguineum]|uniref:uncharacterized protein n=1 Tax=Penicillium atrosanguineum TaxID=1132637 RepID=UPI0023A72D08|nr:uncharacterized protein N7443_001803 [Penicillium atrosanguineum]KAJ5117898.1 hypothetical protein N7526_010921 [Penicillium atrosanguineum]KAJ5309342.1 hypothetical protein N7443_001803 [Penicillium atrosanguineum]